MVLSEIGEGGISRIVMAAGATSALGVGSGFSFGGGVAGRGVDHSNAGRSASGLCAESRFEDTMEAGVAGDFGDPTGPNGGD